MLCVRYEKPPIQECSVLQAWPGVVKVPLLLLAGWPAGLVGGKQQTKQTLNLSLSRVLSKGSVFGSAGEKCSLPCFGV